MEKSSKILQPRWKEENHTNYFSIFGCYGKSRVWQRASWNLLNNLDSLRHSNEFSVVNSLSFISKLRFSTDEVNFNKRMPNIKRRLFQEKDKNIQILPLLLTKKGFNCKLNRINVAFDTLIPFLFSPFKQNKYFIWIMANSVFIDCVSLCFVDFNQDFAIHFGFKIELNWNISVYLQNMHGINVCSHRPKSVNKRNFMRIVSTRFCSENQLNGLKGFATVACNFVFYFKWVIHFCQCERLSIHNNRVFLCKFFSFPRK